MRMFTPARAVAGTWWFSESEPADAQGSGLSVGACGDAVAVSLMSLPTRRTLAISSAVIVSDSFGAGVDAAVLGKPAFEDELKVGGELVLALPTDDEPQPVTASAETRTAVSVDTIARIISPDCETRSNDKPTPRLLGHPSADSDDVLITLSEEHRRERQEEDAVMALAEHLARGTAAAC